MNRIRKKRLTNSKRTSKTQPCLCFLKPFRFWFQPLGSSGLRGHPLLLPFLQFLVLFVAKNPLSPLPKAQSLTPFSLKPLPILLSGVLLLTGCGHPEDSEQKPPVERPTSGIEEPQQQTTINQQPQPPVAPPPPSLIELPTPPPRPELSFGEK